MSASDPSLYSLICRQLQADGYHDIAQQLSLKADAAIDPTIAPNALSSLVAAATAHDAARLSPAVSLSLSASSATQQRAPSPSPVAVLPADGALTEHRSFPPYQSPFVTLHKAPVRASCLHDDVLHSQQRLLATGSDDCTIRLFSLDAILAASAASASASAASAPPAVEPLIRSYYEHSEPITSLCFHPLEPFLISASTDCSIKFFHYSNAAHRRAFTQLQDAYAVRCVAVHPSGDFLLAATDHPVLRLYDLHTLQAFTSCDPKAQHTDAVRAVAYSPDGRLFASASSDGSVRLFSTTSSAPVHVFAAAHSHCIVHSVAFSPDSQSLLSCGRDSTARLFDIGSHRLITRFNGAHHSDGSTPAVFDSTGRWVISADDAYGQVCLWEAEGDGEVQARLSGHSRPVRSISVARDDELFVTGAEDGRVRVWRVQDDTQDNDQGGIKQQDTADEGAA